MTVRILIGDVREQLRTLADNSIHCCVTSPPYWGLRNYGVDGQIGLEATPAEFIAVMVDVFEEVRRVLRPDATCWINMGDSYATGGGAVGRAPGGGEQGERFLRRGMVSTQPNRKALEGFKPKDLCMMPHRLAIALQDAGWWVRQDIVWSKPNPMPESVRDRCTKSHEYIFLLTKSAQYYYDAEAIKEPVVGDPDASRNRFNTKDYDVPGQKPQKRLSRGVGFGHGTDAEECQRERVTAPAKDAGRDDQGLRTAARFGGGAGFRDDPDSRPSTRNKRSVWTMATHSFAEAHFATFPPELPEICIKAGTSEAGHCPECGSRWARKIEKGELVSSGPNAIAIKPRSSRREVHNGEIGSRPKDGYGDLAKRERFTVGWAPTCACGCAPVPDIVLDPFFGAGTSGLVADRLQRDCIGIELNPAYAEIARKRIQGESPLFAEVASTAPEPMKQEQASFAEVL